MTAPLRSLLALGLLLAGGCKLFERAGTVLLEPAGSVTVVDGQLEVLVTTDAGGEVRLVLDGVELPDRVRAGKPSRLQLKVNGTHALSARVYDGGIRLESETTRIVVAWPPPTQLSFQPQSPVFRSDTGLFQARLRFDHELAEVREASVSAPAGPIQARVVGNEMIADVLNVGPLDRGDLVITGKVCDVHGQCAPFLQQWTAPTLSRPYVIGYPASEFLVRGAIEVEASSPVYGLPLQLDLFIDGQPAGMLGTTSPRVLDTTLLTDGLHRLQVMTAGAFPSDDLLIVVDNTAPTATCTASTPADDFVWAFGFEVAFSEPVQPGLWVSWATPTTGFHVSLQRPASYPATFSYDPSSYRDQAGNPAALTGACTFVSPAWRMPWPALLPAGVSPRAIAIEAMSWASVQLLVLDAAGTVRRYSSASPAPDPLAEGETFSVGTARELVDGEKPRWLEGDADGDRVVELFGGERFTAASAPSIGLIASSTLFGGVAWTEPAAGGAVELRYTGYASGPPSTVGTFDAVTGAVTGSSGVYFAASPSGGGPARLVRWREFPLSVTAPLNLDPAQAATHPALARFTLPSGSADFLVWEEAGDVLLRVIPDGAPPSEPRRLDSAPGVAARWPRVANTVFAFVEREDGLDRFELRVDYGDGSLSALPSLPTGGQVASYAIHYTGTGVAWVDSEGVAHVRVLQEGL